MSFEKTVDVTNIKQLVDINGELTNFKAHFEVSIVSGEKFKMAIADQNMLDEGGEPQYKEIDGSISGDITMDKNVLGHFYIILKSDNPSKVHVKVDIQELPMKKIDYDPQKMPPPEGYIPGQTPGQTPHGPGNQIPQGPPRGQMMRQTRENFGTPGFKMDNIWKYIAIAAIVGIVGFVGYKFLIQKKSGENPVDNIKSPPREKGGLNFGKSRFIHT